MPLDSREDSEQRFQITIRAASHFPPVSELEFEIFHSCGPGELSLSDSSLTIRPTSLADLVVIARSTTYKGWEIGRARIPVENLLFRHVAALTTSKGPSSTLHLELPLGRSAAKLLVESTLGPAQPAPSQRPMRTPGYLSGRKQTRAMMDVVRLAPATPAVLVDEPALHTPPALQEEGSQSGSNASPASDEEEVGESSLAAFGMDTEHMDAETKRLLLGTTAIDLERERAWLHLPSPKAQSPRKSVHSAPASTVPYSGHDSPPRNANHNLSVTSEPAEPGIIGGHGTGLLFVPPSSSNDDGEEGAYAGEPSRVLSDVESVEGVLVEYPRGATSPHSPSTSVRSTSGSVTTAGFDVGHVPVGQGHGTGTPSTITDDDDALTFYSAKSDMFEEEEEELGFGSPILQDGARRLGMPSDSLVVYQARVRDLESRVERLETQLHPEPAGPSAETTYDVETQAKLMQLQGELAALRDKNQALQTELVHCVHALEERDDVIKELLAEL